MTLVTFNLEDNINRQFEICCSLTDTTKSEVLRNAVQNFLKKNFKDGTMTIQELQDNF